jgi:oleate hydratase
LTEDELTAGLPNLSALKFTKYNQYESFVLPLRAYLESHGVKFQHGTRVTDLTFSEDCTLATRIDWETTDADGEVTPGGVDLTPADLLFTTIGSLVENSVNGDHHTAATTNRGPAPAWDLWRRIAAQSPTGKFGNPNVFGAYDQIDKTRWESCTVTTLDTRIPAYIERICKRDPFSGRVVTGGIVTAKDSAWLLSWTVNRQPHFKAQPADQIVAWVFALNVDVPGDYVKKPMEQCTGEEITQEWLYHMGVPATEIPEMAASGATAIPTMMPYVTSFFMPRAKGDRPAVIPEGARNFSFIGQFAESRTRDTIFTTEYSVRTAMEAVYGHLEIERGIPEVFNSTYDIRWVAAAMTALNDGEAINPRRPGRVVDWVLGKIEDMSIGEVLARTGMLKDVRPEAQRLADD